MHLAGDVKLLLVDPAQSHKDHYALLFAERSFVSSCALVRWHCSPKFTEAQILFALRQADTVVTVAEVCRKLSISEATYYNWKKKYGGLGVPELRRLKQLEEENQPL
jgi:putative transposase